MSDRLLRVGCLVSASVGLLIGCERREAPGGKATEFGIVSTAQAATPSAAPATARPAVSTRPTKSAKATSTGTQPAKTRDTMTGMAAIDRAAKAKKHLFVFFYKAEDKQTRAMRKVFDSAVQRMADKAMAVTVRLDDPREKKIVEKFRADRAPMPLVLVLAPNGAIAGGFPREFTERQLVEAFASPCLQKCLKALQQRKLVLLCIHGKASKGNAEAMQGVRDFKADQRFAKATEIVMVNPAESTEARFLKTLRVDPETDQAVTVLLAPPGSVVGTFKGAVDKPALVAALEKALSACGAGGCGPKGCGP